MRKAVILLSVMLSFVACDERGLYRDDYDSDEEVPEYNVTLMNDGESSVYVCACMAEEPVLRRDGYAFVGWFSDETLLDQVTFPVFFTQDTVFYAKWNKIE